MGRIRPMKPWNNDHCRASFSERPPAAPSGRQAEKTAPSVRGQNGRTARGELKAALFQVQGPDDGGAHPGGVVQQAGHAVPGLEFAGPGQPAQGAPLLQDHHSRAAPSGQGRRGQAVVAPRRSPPGRILLTRSQGASLEHGFGGQFAGSAHDSSSGVSGRTAHPQAVHRSLVRAQPGAGRAKKSCSRVSSP